MERGKRPPAGAAVLQAEVTASITTAVLDELAEVGYSALTMEAVARRAGAGKSALYRRWPAKQDMVIGVLAELSVPLAEVPDTGSLRDDVAATVRAVHAWLSHPRVARILPDLVAEAGRSAALARALADAVAGPRRALGAATLARAVQRGELAADVDVELALDLLAAPVYWRLVVRHTPFAPGELDRVTGMLLRALGVADG